jgi:hypothetical protein
MFQRMLRAARLDPAFYEMVEADPKYILEALYVVILASAASGLGSAIHYGGVVPFVRDLISGLITWVVWAGVTLWIGTTVTRGPETRSDMGEMLRVLGYSYAPRILAFFVFVPVLGGLLVAVALVWQLLAGVVAIRQALDFTTGRAVATVILGWIALVAITVVLGLVFGAGAWMMGKA